MTVLGLDWTDQQAIGYPLLFVGVLVGSIVPVVPTGAVVGAAAAVAMSTGHLSLPLVVLLSTVAALIGDVVTFGVARWGGEAAVRRITRNQSPTQLAKARTRFERQGWQLVVIGRLVPAGRIPVLVAAGSLGYRWTRFVPAATVACVVWAVLYTVLGVVSGGLFDNPLVASLGAALLVLVVAAASAGVSALVRRRKSARAVAAGQAVDEDGDVIEGPGDVIERPGGPGDPRP